MTSSSLVNFQDVHFNLVHVQIGMTILQKLSKMKCTTIVFRKCTKISVFYEIYKKCQKQHIGHLQIPTLEMYLVFAKRIHWKCTQRIILCSSTTHSITTIIRTVTTKTTVNMVFRNHYDNGYLENHYENYKSKPLWKRLRRKTIMKMVNRNHYENALLKTVRPLRVNIPYSIYKHSLAQSSYFKQCKEIQK